MNIQLKKNISSLVVADIVGKLLPLLTFPYMTRVLGPEAYGKYGFAMNVVGFLMLLSSPGFIPYGMRAVAQSRGDEKVLGAKIVALRLLFTAAAFSLLLLYMFFLAPDDDILRLLLLLAGLSMLPSAINLAWLLTGRSLITPVAVSGVISQIVYTAAVLLFVKDAQSVWVVPVGAFAGELVCVAILFYAVNRNFGLKWPHVSLQDFKEIVPTALMLGFASLMCMTFDKVDTIILGYFRPMEEVGLYSAAYKIMWMVMSFQPILAQVFLPLMAQAGAEGAEHNKGNSKLYLKMNFFIAFPMLFGGLLLAEPLTLLLLGEKYTGSDVILKILLPNVIAGGLSAYFAGLKLFAANRNKEYVISVSSGAAVNLVLCLVFIPRYGVAAAAAMTSISQFTVAGVAAWYLRKDGFEELKTTIRIPLILSLLMSFFVWGGIQIFPDLHVLVAVTFGGLFYFLCWLLIKRLSWL